MSAPLLIALGAFFGAPLRYYLDYQLRRRFSFPGAFTTWSAFALDLNKDLRHPRRFLANVFATLILGILAAGFGQALAS
jgi:CrcB protein